MLIVLNRNLTKPYAVSIRNGGGQRGKERGKGKGGEGREGEEKGGKGKGGERRGWRGGE